MKENSIFAFSAWMWFGVINIFLYSLINVMFMYLPLVDKSDFIGTKQTLTLTFFLLISASLIAHHLSIMKSLSKTKKMLNSALIAISCAVPCYYLYVTETLLNVYEDGAGLAYTVGAQNHMLSNLACSLSLNEQEFKQKLDTLQMSERFKDIAGEKYNELWGRVKDGIYHQCYDENNESLSLEIFIKKLREKTQG